MSDFILESRLWKTEGAVPRFGHKLKIYLMQENEASPTKRQMEIFNSLQHLPEGLLEEIAAHALGYFHRIDAEVNLAGEGITIDALHIENHFQLKSILIPEIAECVTNYFFVSADCDWELEHGMQILIADAHVIWCGDHTGFPFGSRWTEVIYAPTESRGELLRQLLP